MPNKKKTGPWRPSKKFVATPKEKKSGPGRPKKIEKEYDLPLKSKRGKGFRVTNILHAPRKDNIILLLFLFSLIIFIFALYVAVLKWQKESQAATLSPITTQQPPNIQTGNIPYPTDTGDDTLAAQPTDLAALVTQFYTAMNQKDVATMNSLADQPLRLSNEYKTYYSRNRLNIFLGGVPNGVQPSDIQLVPRTGTDLSVQKVTYTLQYTLTNTQSYTEDRSIIFIKRGENYKIGKIMCDTVKCSQMPFFNPGKYGIK